MTYGHNCHAWGMSKQNRQLSSAIVVLGESAGSSPRHNSPQRRCSASPGKTVLVGSSRYEPANYLTRGGERARDKANEEKLMKLNKAAMKVKCLDKQLPVATCSHKAQYDDAADPSAAASTPARSIYNDRRCSACVVVTAPVVAAGMQELQFANSTLAQQLVRLQTEGGEVGF